MGSCTASESGVSGNTEGFTSAARSNSITLPKYFSYIRGIYSSRTTLGEKRRVFSKRAPQSAPLTDHRGISSLLAARNRSEYTPVERSTVLVDQERRDSGGSPLRLLTSPAAIIIVASGTRSRRTTLYSSRVLRRFCSSRSA